MSLDVHFCRTFYITLASLFLYLSAVILAVAWSVHDIVFCIFLNRYAPCSFYFYICCATVLTLGLKSRVYGDPYEINDEWWWWDAPTGGRDLGSLHRGTPASPAFLSPWGLSLGSPEAKLSASGTAGIQCRKCRLLSDRKATNRNCWSFRWSAMVRPQFKLFRYWFFLLEEIFTWAVTCRFMQRLLPQSKMR